MFNLVKWQKKMSITMCIILLIVSVSGFYADDGEFFIPSSNVIDLTERNEVQLNGYAYSPKSEDDFKFFGDVVLNIDLVSKKGEIISEIGVFQLDFNLEKFENGRIDYFGKAISDQEKFELLISVLNDKGMKVYGLIDGAFAFNAGTTIGYSDFREKARLSTQSLLQDNTDIIVRSSDPYVVDDGTKNSVYAQLIKPSVHPYGEVRTYGIRLNTTNCGTAALRSVREFKVEGDVSGAALINTDPSGYGTLPTPWGLQLLYYIASYVGIYVDSSEGLAYKGSIINSTYEMKIGANEKWNNFIYSSDSSSNGCGFKLHINNDSNQLPDITVHTYINIYETLTGYLTITGPTLYY